jgi:hypothetical protein
MAALAFLSRLVGDTAPQLRQAAFVPDDEFVVADGVSVLANPQRTGRNVLGCISSGSTSLAIPIRPRLKLANTKHMVRIVQ